ncbi:hypothetical protein ADL27_58865, partial [Streptomyces sp. NRRL F-6602]
MLVMPSVVASLTGEGALLVWSAHLVLGATVSLLLALLVRTRRTPATLAGTVGALLGGWAARAVDGVFAILYPKMYDEIVRLVAERAPKRDE